MDTLIRRKEYLCQQFFDDITNGKKVYEGRLNKGKPYHQNRIKEVQSKMRFKMFIVDGIVKKMKKSTVLFY
jgi:hypothetical protein